MGVGSAYWVQQDHGYRVHRWIYICQRINTRRRRNGDPLTDTQHDVPECAVLRETMARERGCAAVELPDRRAVAVEHR